MKTVPWGKHVNEKQAPSFLSIPEAQPTGWVGGHKNEAFGIPFGACNLDKKADRTLTNLMGLDSITCCEL